MILKPLSLLGCLALATGWLAQPLLAQVPVVPEVSSYTTPTSTGVSLLTSSVSVLSDYGSAYQMGFSSADVLQANIENRLEDIRIGAPGFSTPLGGQNWLSKHPKLVSAPDTPWGTYIIGTGDFGHLSGQNNVPGYDFYTAGFLMGVDYRPIPGLAIGIAGGYNHDHADFSASGPVYSSNARINTDSGFGGLYATYFQRGFYLNGYSGGAYNSYDLRRSASAFGSNSGSTSGGQFNGFIGTGFDFRLNHWTFGPIGSLAYTTVNIDGFDESRDNGALVRLHLFDESQDSFRSNLGFRVLKDFPMGTFGLYPELRVSWQHEYLYTSLPVNARLANGSGSGFSFTGPSIGHDSVLVHFGLQLRVGDQWKGFAAYDGDLARDHYISNAVSGGLSYSF